MKPDAFRVVRDFEAALCEYTGAPYAVAVNSCTMALLLAVAWSLKNGPMTATEVVERQNNRLYRRPIEIPKRTYVSVPMSIIHAGGRPTFRDEDWRGAYQLKPLRVWDSARRFRQGMYNSSTRWDPDGNEHALALGDMVCVSFHWSKILGIQQGGAILHDNADADAWLRRARFDGRAEGVDPKSDTFAFLGWHCIMSPEVAAEGLVRIFFLPEDNDDLPNSDYPDLSLCPLFKT